LLAIPFSASNGKPKYVPISYLGTPKYVPISYLGTPKYVPRNQINAISNIFAPIFIGIAIAAYTCVQAPPVFY